MKWTKDQQQAIEIREKNLLVSAAAGSGKTALLIERIRRIIIEEGVPVDRLLVLTFTRAAASEMKERLSRALMKELSEPHTDKAYIIQQINLLGAASISTLHSFCNSVIREYFQEVGIDPEFSLISDAERAIMIQETLDEVFETAYSKISEDEENDFSRLLEMFSDNRSDKGLKNLVEKFHQFLSTQPDPEKWCEEALTQFDLDENTFWDSSWGEAFKREMQTDLEGAEQLLARACSRLEKTEMGFEKTLEQVGAEYETLKQINQSFTDNDYDYFRTMLAHCSFPRYKGNKKADAELSDNVKDIRTEAKGIVTKWQEQNRYELREALELIASMKKSMITLINLTKTFEQCFSEKKRAKNLLDFNDLEAYTLQVLKRREIAEELRERFVYIFLDEYQDTNEMQETIIQQIVRKDNYFMVGDVKQSIYRFRLADPTIFIDKYRKFQTVTQKNDKLVTLSQNFRSAAGVIDSVNAVFEAIMSPELGEVEYDHKAKLYKGLSAEGDYRKSEVYVIEQPNNALDEDAEDLSEIEVEARFIGEKIREQVGKPFYDTKKDEIRLLEYRDIAVLMRTISGRGEVFAKVFSEMGIPAYYDGGSNYYESLEIGVIMNLLAVIDNKHQDIPLLSVMTSPIGNFSLEECTEIRLADREHRYYAAAENYSMNHEDALADKLRAFYEKLERWRKASRIMDVENFLWMLYMETGYYHFVGALPGGDTRQNNLRLLLKRAGDYKRSTLKGIFYFIQFVERMKKSGSDMGTPSILSDQEDVVRIMTIHKSKGLEFPFVYLAGMGKRFNKRDNSGKVLFHKQLGICPEYVDLKRRVVMNTLAQEICTSQNTMEMLSEEMRLLYVAMTRAQEGFTAVGSIKQKDLPGRMKQWGSGTDVYQLKKAAGLLDWLMQAAQAKCALVLSNQYREVETDCFKLKVLTRDEALSLRENLEEAFFEMPVGERTVLDEEIERRLGFVYAGQEEEPPGKISVTELRRLKDGQGEPELEMRLEKPVFMEEIQETWSAAQRGTAMHTLLEHLCLSEIHLDQEDSVLLEHLERERRALSDREILPRGLAECIDLQIILRFMRTALFERLLSAKQVYREWPFYYKMAASELKNSWKNSEESVIVQGMIDCAFLEEDGWVLLDYKSDGYSSASGKAAIIARYRDQIECYAKALNILTGIPIKEKVLCLLRMNDQIVIQ